jgi:transposase
MNEFRFSGMQAMQASLENIRVIRADHLPIVAAFCRRVGLVETINRVVPTNMEVDVGTTMLALVLDTLSGRSPLYRLKEFFEHQDSEQLLGLDLPATALNDTTVGRAMDAVFEVGAEKVFNSVAFEAAKGFPLDMQVTHFDTTSISVWGDYDICDDSGDMLNITHGFSKDHRPDLKQFLIKMLCVGRNIPILASCEDGNASDKRLNTDILNRISDHMGKFGLAPGAFLYVADSAFVTEDNLKAVGKNTFVTRLPFSYKAAGQVVTEAITEGIWQEIGTLNQTACPSKHPAARYKVAEQKVSLYEREYRAIVVHSTAHDKRRLKRIEREIGESKAAVRKIVADQAKREYFCQPDAEKAAAALRQAGTHLHGIEASVKQKVRYARGRPRKDGSRKISSVRYLVEAKIVENKENLEKKREESGCFVLLTNVPKEGKTAKSGQDLLEAYKDQHGIERNFSFLKDPLIVNDLFLKLPHRVEVLGAVLLIALLVWNLIEHVLRQYVIKSGQTLTGWDNKPTRRPTAFMMSTKFSGLQFLKANGQRQLLTRLDPIQLRYLNALKLSTRHLLEPSHPPDWG